MKLNNAYCITQQWQTTTESQQHTIISIYFTHLWSASWELADLGWAGLNSSASGSESSWLYGLFHVSRSELQVEEAAPPLGEILLNVRTKVPGSTANRALWNSASTFQTLVCMTSTIFPGAKVSRMAKPKVKEAQGRTHEKYREIIPLCISHVRGTEKLHGEEHGSREQWRLGAEKSICHTSSEGCWKY